jgi:hypothetical protein
MDSKSTGNRLYRSLILAVFSCVVMFAVLESHLRAALSVALQSPTKSLVGLNMKFNGAGSCSNSACHGAAQPKDTPNKEGDEFTVWSTKDKHSTAYKTLTTDPLSKKIATAMKIGAPEKSGECLSCHALDVPAPLQGTKYSIKEGTTCNGCHGPSDKWLAPHTAKGWIDKQRVAIPDHEALLKTVGIFDTKPILPRADRCTSCHLAMDAKLISAGHPQPVFELAYFSEVEPKHWKDEDGLYIVKVWATGQSACLRDALLQVADRLDTKADAKGALAQMQGHYLMFKEIAKALALPKAAAIDAAVASLDKAPASATATTAAADVAAMAEIVGKTDFTAEQTAKMLKAILATDAPSKIGPLAQLQQAEAIYEIYNAYSSAAGLSDQPASDAAAALPPQDKPSGPLADFAKNLKDARAKIKLK